MFDDDELNEVSIPETNEEDDRNSLFGDDARPN